MMTTPYKYTEGIEYEGYGTRYLDILKRMTTDGSWIADEQGRYQLAGPVGRDGFHG